MTSLPPPGDHLDATDVAAYVDGTLGEAARARAEVHLAACQECRREVIEIRRLLAGVRRRLRWPALAALAAAAVVLVIVWPRAAEQGGPAAPVVRDGEPTVAQVVLVAPDSVASLPLSFAWRPAPTATTYRLSLTSPSGELIWTGSTSDTAIVLPDSVSLTAGRSFYYYVDALLVDGSSITSGIRSLRVP